MQDSENADSTNQNPFPIYRPDWSYWKSVKSIKLWQAVALACDLDPFQYTFIGSPNLNRMFNRLPESFDTLLTMAKGSLGSGNVLKLNSFSPDGIKESEISPSVFGAWITSIRYQVPTDFPWQDAPELPLSREWPWGRNHETELLRKLAAAAERFWKRYDPNDPTTAPTNETVTNWLIDQKVSKRNAEVMATILRVDGLPTGPRK